MLEFPDEEEQDGPEGCLSIPGLYFDTKRRQNVVAKGFNGYGDPVQIVGTGLMARCVQHETDHLDGVLFLDRLDAGRPQGGDEGDPPGRVVRRRPPRRRSRLSPHASAAPSGWVGEPVRADLRRYARPSPFPPWTPSPPPATSCSPW